MGDPVSIAAIASTAASGLGILEGHSRSRSQSRFAAIQRQQEMQQLTLQQRLKEKQLERERRSKVASARARLGAAGVGSSGGSGGAVLQGLNKTYDEALNDSRSLHGLSMRGLNLLEDNSSSNALGLGRQLLSFGSEIADTYETVKKP